jgi:methylaspartate ammonia-lyase
MNRQMFRLDVKIIQPAYVLHMVDIKEPDVGDIEGTFQWI